MNAKTIKTIAKFAKKAGFPGEVTEENAQAVTSALAQHHTESFARELEKGYDLAAKYWAWGTDQKTQHLQENCKLIQDNLDSILALLDIKTDYPGLYPTFELDRNGKHLTEYSTLNALRQYNNFWGHW